MGWAPAQKWAVCLIPELVRDVKFQEMCFYGILTLPLPNTGTSRWQGWHCTQSNPVGSHRNMFSANEHLWPVQESNFGTAHFWAGAHPSEPPGKNKLNFQVAQRGEHLLRSGQPQVWFLNWSEMLNSRKCVFMESIPYPSITLVQVGDKDDTVHSQIL